MTRVIAPNGLPATCVRADGTQLEHEHADHGTYMYPVYVVYEGEVSPNDHSFYEAMAGHPAPSDDAVRELYEERHALIYQDRSAALTLYEYGYYLWALKDGRSLSHPGRKYRLVVPLQPPTPPTS